MKNPATLKSLIGLSLASITAPALSAPPQMGANYHYGGWTVNNGVIDTTASCSAAGVTSCKALATDNGFLQEEVRLDNGQKYIRLIMTESGVTGDPSLSGAAANLEFASEGFTTFLTNTECNAVAGSLPNTFQDCQGVAIKQDVRELASGFDSTAEIQRNFAKSNEPNLADKFNIKLNQSIDTIDATTGLAFQTGFDYTEYSYWECTIAGTCNNTLQIGKRMDLSSTIFLDPLDGTKKQEFRQIEADGWAGRQSGGWFQSTPVVDTNGLNESVTLGGRTINGVTTGAPTVFSWNSSSSGGGGWGGWGGGSGVANTIKSTWVASNLIDGFDYQNFTLNGTSDNQVLLDPAGANGDIIDPFTWAPSMGPQPAF